MSAPSRPGAPRSSPRGSAARATTTRSRTGAGASSAAKTRPSGPSAPARPTTAKTPQWQPAGPRGSWASMLSWRAAVLTGVVILAVAVLLPTLRVYFDQQAELSELRAEVEQERAEVAGLEAEVARWDDPAFLQAQARERLAYVFPGETPYRVIDPEFVTTHAEGSPASDRAAQEDPDTVWYDVMWASLDQAGNGPALAEVEDEETADPEQLTDVDFGG